MVNWPVSDFGALSRWGVKGQPRGICAPGLTELARRDVDLIVID
jgi:hypothetical protein